MLLIDEVDREAERLALSCRRLIWLNPLPRWETFEAKAGGIRSLLPHVDSSHACHSLDRIRDLAAALGTSWGGPRRSSVGQAISSLRCIVAPESCRFQDEGQGGVAGARLAPRVDHVTKDTMSVNGRKASRDVPEETLLTNSLARPCA